MIFFAYLLKYINIIRLIIINILAESKDDFIKIWFKVIKSIVSNFWPDSSFLELLALE
jgi:hypothetical protein